MSVGGRTGKFIEACQAMSYDIMPKIVNVSTYFITEHFDLAVASMSDGAVRISWIIVGVNLEVKG